MAAGDERQRGDGGRTKTKDDPDERRDMRATSMQYEHDNDKV